MRIAFLVAVIALASAGVEPGLAGQPVGKRTWAEEKCARYKRDWTEALRRWGADGLSRDFVDGNEAFIASGCAGEAKVCPRSARERELVDVLTIRVVNAGMSSTFLPFACRD